MNRPTRRMITAATMAFACIVALPPTVGADDATVGADDEANAISNLSVGEATIDVASHTATVVVHFECAADLPYVRARIVLVQVHSVALRWATDPTRPGHVWAVGDRYLDGYTCSAGSAVDVPMQFPSFFGVFSPGPAEISGWVSSPFPSGHQTLEPTRILLHPGG